MTTLSLRNQIIKVGFSGLGGQIITFLALPLLSRAYSPEVFGAWALFISVALLIGTVSTMRYELAVVLPRRDAHAAAVLVASAAVATLVALVTLLLTPLLSGWLFDAGTTSLLWLLPLFVLASAGYQLGLAWCTRRSAFSAYSLGQFLLPAGTAVAQCVAALAGLTDARGLIVGSLLGFLAGGSVLWWSMLRHDRPTLARGLSARRALAAMRRYYKYPAFMTPYSFLSVLRDRAIYFVLASQGGAAAGLYAMAQRFTNIPNSLVAGAVRPVFFQHAARRGMQSVAPLASSIMAILLVLTVPNVIVFAFYAAPIMGFLFGSAWAEAAPYAVLLAMPAVPLLLGNWLDRVLDLNNRQGLALWMEVVFSITAVVSILLGYFAFNDLLVAVGLQAAAMFVYFSVWIVVVFRVAGFQMQALLRLAGLGMGLAAASAGLLSALAQAMPAMLAAGVFYVVFFAVLVHLYRRYGTVLRAVLA